MPDIIKDRSSTLGPGATERFVDVTGLNEMAQQVVLVGGGGGGALTDAQLRATPVPVSGTVAVTGAYPATQPVSGPLTDTQLRAVAVPVSLATAPTLVAGTALIGKVGIDQTTPGTTNKVVASQVARTPIVAIATGAAAIVKSTAASATAFLLHSVTCHFSAAPTTSESLTVTLNALAGAAYDTVLCKVNPSVGALTDIAFLPDAPILCQAGDVIDVAYTNTDTRTYGVRIVTESV